MVRAGIRAPRFSVATPRTTHHGAPPHDGGAGGASDADIPLTERDRPARWPMAARTQARGPRRLQAGPRGLPKGSQEGRRSSIATGDRASVTRGDIDRCRSTRRVIDGISYSMGTRPGRSFQTNQRSISRAGPLRPLRPRGAFPSTRSAMPCMGLDQSRRCRRGVIRPPRNGRREVMKAGPVFGRTVRKFLGEPSAMTMPTATEAGALVPPIREMTPPDSDGRSVAPGKARRAKGEGAIDRVKGKWRVRVVVDGTTRSWILPTKAEARAKLQEVKRERARGTLTVRHEAEVTLGEWVDEWLQEPWHGPPAQSRRVPTQSEKRGRPPGLRDAALAGAGQHVAVCLRRHAGTGQHRHDDEVRLARGTPVLCGRRASGVDHGQPYGRCPAQCQGHDGADNANAGGATAAVRRRPAPPQRRHRDRCRSDGRARR